jgi:hypothetical protein
MADRTSEASSPLKGRLVHFHEVEYIDDEGCKYRPSQQLMYDIERSTAWQKVRPNSPFSFFVAPVYKNKKPVDKYAIRLNFGVPYWDFYFEDVLTLEMGNKAKEEFNTWLKRPCAGSEDTGASFVILRQDLDFDSDSDKDSDAMMMLIPVEILKKKN